MSVCKHDWEGLSLLSGVAVQRYICKICKMYGYRRWKRVSYKKLRPDPTVTPYAKAIIAPPTEWSDPLYFEDFKEP